MFRQLKGFLALLAILILPLGVVLAAGNAVPGAVNYVEGQVTVAGQPVTPVGDWFGPTTAGSGH